MNQAKYQLLSIIIFERCHTAGMNKLFEGHEISFALPELYLHK